MPASTDDRAPCVCSSAAWNGVSLDLASYYSLFKQNSFKLRRPVILQNRANRFDPVLRIYRRVPAGLLLSLRTRPHTITQNNPGHPLTIVS